jgi:hypothetical protein
VPKAAKDVGAVLNVELISKIGIGFVVDDAYEVSLASPACKSIHLELIVSLRLTPSYV